MKSFVLERFTHLSEAQTCPYYCFQPDGFCCGGPVLNPSEAGDFSTQQAKSTNI